jgi:hypothetical protein
MTDRQRPSRCRERMWPSARIGLCRELRTGSVRPSNGGSSCALPMSFGALDLSGKMWLTYCMASREMFSGCEEEMVASVEIGNTKPTDLIR